MCSLLYEARHGRGMDALAGRVELRCDAFIYAAFRLDRIESLKRHDNVVMEEYLLKFKNIEVLQKLNLIS